MFRNNWVCVWHSYVVSMFSYSSNETVPHLQKSDIETCGAIELELVTLNKGYHWEDTIPMRLKPTQNLKTMGLWALSLYGALLSHI